MKCINVTLANLVRFGENFTQTIMETVLSSTLKASCLPALYAGGDSIDKPPG